MLWSKIAGCKPGKEVVSFFGKESNEISCIESSDLEITCGDKPTHSFAVSGLRKDATNLIVVEIKLLNDKGHYYGKHCAFVEICYTEESQIFEASLKDWTPSSVNRIGVVDTNGFVKIRINNNTFFTNPKHDKDTYFIGKKNVCCSYLAGLIDAEDVTAAAEETQRQISLQERYNDLEERYDDLKRANKMLSVELDLIRGANIRLIAEHKRDWDSLQDKIFGWEKAATRLRDAVRSPLIKKRYGCSKRGGGFMFETRGARVEEALRLFPDIKHYDRSLKSELIIKE